MRRSKTIPAIGAITVAFFFLCLPCLYSFASLDETEKNIDNRLVEKKQDAASVLQEHTTEPKGSTMSKLSQLTDEEKSWFLKFQNGIPFFDGWKDISKNILSSFPEEKKEKIKEHLKILGDKIGIEWAKDNSIRKIDTDMLRQWGKKLNKAVDKGFRQVAETISRVENEVDEILTKKLAQKSKE